MPKISRNYRFDSLTIKRLEVLAEYYSVLRSNDRESFPAADKPVTLTEMLEFLINDHYIDLFDSGSLSAVLGSNELISFPDSK